MTITTKVFELVPGFTPTLKEIYSNRGYQSEDQIGYDLQYFDISAILIVVSQNDGRIWIVKDGTIIASLPPL